MCIKGSNLIWIVCILSILYSLAKFPISLTIELVSSDENGTTFFSCVKQKQIGRYSLILMYLYDMTDFDTSRLHMCIVSFIS